MEKVVDLNKLLATLSVLSSNLKGIHWNIRGNEFFELHEETGELITKTEDFIDRVAEKIVMHEKISIASPSEMLAHSVIKEAPSRAWHAKDAAGEIVKDLRTLFTVVDEYDQKVSVRIQPLIDDIVTTYDKYHWWFSALLK